MKSLRRLYFAGLMCLLSMQAVADSAAMPAPALALDDYAQRAPAKALAVSADTPAVYGIAAAQSNDIAASTLALRNCEAQRTADSGACEIVRLNDETVSRGQDILARIPDSPHPLYLWRYQGPDATVFLAGSIHLLKQSLYPLPLQYQQAYALAEQLVLEVDINAYSAAEVQQKTRRFATLPADQSLSDVLPPPLYQRLRQHLARYGLENAAIEKAKPSLLMNQLVVARLLALGYLPEHGVEQYFVQQHGARPIQQLETLDSQLQLLFEQPMPVQIQLLADTLDQEMAIEPVLTGMLVAWLSGDDDTLAALFAEQTGDSPAVREFTEQVLDHRNVAMADAISTLINSGKGTYFVVIGAAHCLGAAGIPALLARHGIQGRRITSDTPVELLRP